MSKIDPRTIELLAGLFFTRSRGFNGLPLRSVLATYSDEPAVKSVLAECLRNKRVNCAFASVSGNPHIKRLRDLPVERQIELLMAEPIGGICLYPCADIIREHVDVEEYNNRPFTKKLLLGGCQLDWEGFDLGVLERYQNDPRYHFDFYDHSGKLSISDSANEDKSVPERDRVFLQSFGVGYGESDNRLAVVFNRYLADLSPEHQQYWNSFRTQAKLNFTANTIEARIWVNGRSTRLTSTRYWLKCVS